MKLPLPKDLYNERWLRYQFWIFIAAMSILCVGVLIDELLIIRVGLFTWIIVAILYVLNVAKVLLHKPITHSNGNSN